LQFIYKFEQIFGDLIDGNVIGVWKVYLLIYFLLFFIELKKQGSLFLKKKKKYQLRLGANLSSS